MPDDRILSPAWVDGVKHAIRAIGPDAFDDDDFVLLLHSHERLRWLANRLALALSAEHGLDISIEALEAYAENLPDHDLACGIAGCLPSCPRRVADWRRDHFGDHKAP